MHMQVRPIFADVTKYLHMPKCTFKYILSMCKVSRLITQPPFTYSKLTIETLEQGKKYVQN